MNIFQHQRKHVFYSLRSSRIPLLLLVNSFLIACVASQPNNITNVCSIFEDRRGWYSAAKSAEDRWGIPIAVNMAFIYQESSFRALAKPERTRILWVIPGPRPSSAYGYAQALDGTWDDYRETSGNSRASRSDFNDSIDFIAWYNRNSRRINDISTLDARNLYFAYHEGNGGYRRGTHWDKPWLLNAADRVQTISERFAIQLNSCRHDLEKNWFQRLLSK